ncbi:MAG: hypothetical protein KDD06_09130 [Phaeodactylibacter sp.]|nr:hypothetical protein [Phaeodactylibacter sp.]MCB9263703.1 hypothetical protein [Lewinellaceae bacterium]
MRNSLICFFMFFFQWIALHAQSDCSMFYPFKEGVKLEYTYYDKKGKLESKSQSVIKTVKALPNGVEAVITNTIFDKKDKEQFAGEYLIRCEGGVVKMDASTMLNPAMQQSFANMEVSIEGEDLTIPKKLTEGQELPDASTNIKAGTGGINIVNMTVNITDRRVLGKESVTTPAGTFDCYKVTQTTDVKMMLGKEFSSIEYYAEGIGVVRSETYDKKGNLDGYMELTSFEK